MAGRGSSSISGDVIEESIKPESVHWLLDHHNLLSKARNGVTRAQERMHDRGRSIGQAQSTYRRI
jgi:hypothetical protein